MTTTRHDHGPVLVGMRGTGKSTLAPLVARRLSMDHVDADAEIERREGRSVAEIFSLHGEVRFRRIEREVLLDDLLRRKATVVACGGGAVLHDEVRSVLGGRATFLLTAPLAVLQRRTVGTGRPELGMGPAEVLASRARLYEEVARVTIDTSIHDVPSAVAIIGREFEQMGGAP